MTVFFFITGYVVYIGYADKVNEPVVRVLGRFPPAASVPSAIDPFVKRSDLPPSLTSA